METEDQSNIECHKVLAGMFDRHETIADMDTCRAIDMMTDPEECDGWTQQVVDRNKKCCGAKSGHLGHLFELQQKVSERRIKELGSGGNHVAGGHSSNNRDHLRRVAGRCGERNAGRSCCRQKQ